MFKRKYTTTIINSKWDVIKNNIKLDVIPRQYEYIYLDDKYYEVIKVIHKLESKQNIFIVIDEAFDVQK